MKNKRVFVGLSGGVDSSVAALLLKKEGYDVHGVMMSVWDNAFNGGMEIKRPGCYGPDEEKDIETAKNVSKKLGIPFTLIDLKKEYRKYIIEYFMEEYKSGKTPNPCVRCNRNIKFGFLMDRLAESGGFDYFATGHYARVVFNEQLNEYQILKAVDDKKDQSYFLYNLCQEKLKKILFPLGNLLKNEVKEIAKELGLGLENRKESMDFSSAGNDKILEAIDSEEGDIVDAEGTKLGRHRGLQYYTIGQRRGLNVSGGRPLYVVDIDKGKNTVTVDDEKLLLKKSFSLKDVNWITGKQIDFPLKAKVRIRYRSREEEALIENAGNEKISVTFIKPQRAVTPGQSAVFYRGEHLLGGGIIERVYS